jgi:cytochrome c peroxidase
MAGGTRTGRARRSGSILISLLLAVGAGPVAAESLVPDGRDGGPGVRAADALGRLKSQYGRPPVIPFPADNQYTRQRELLGRTLFFDPRLSASKIVSCATCHNPALSWGDGLPKAVGHGMTQLARRTPTILNLAWSERLFWDGRAESLEEQALGPIEAPGEMNMPLPRVIETLQGIPGYRAMFEAAYPGEGITPRTLGKAIATFERTIVSGMAPFDEWLAGQAAISDAAVRGFVLFNTKASCVKCHAGWSFTDHSFHDLGMASGDLGRGRVLKTIERMRHAFKTPTLRNVEARRPYMHDGSLATLEDVITYYDRGGDARRASLSAEMRPLGLSDVEKRDLVAFLKTLTSADTPIQIPVLPR